MVASILPLSIDKAVVRKRGKQLLGPITWTLQAGGPTVVMGPNGSGKTTLLRLMHGLERPREGTLSWMISGRSCLERQSFVFQSPILMRRSVLENVAYPLLLRGKRRKEAIARAEAWTSKTGLEKVANRDVFGLSGGERQKMALARALITQPDVLFLDEPTTNLDGAATRDIEALLEDAVTAGTKIVLTTHQIGQARRLAVDILFLHQGRIHETSDAKSFFDGPATSEASAYLNGDIVV